jgi:hypothetical protein
MCPWLHFMNFGSCKMNEIQANFSSDLKWSLVVFCGRFYDKKFRFLWNFVTSQLVMLCTNNAVTYRIGIKNKHHKNGPRQLIFCDISVLDRSNFTMLKIPSWVHSCVQHLWNFFLCNLRFSLISWSVWLWQTVTRWGAVVAQRKVR